MNSPNGRKGKIMNTRIELTDTPMSAVIKMVEGNPGALSVSMSLLKHGDEIDPQSAFGGFGNILDFDTLGIYASDIWVLAKYVCAGRVDNLVLLLRSQQLGITRETDILSAIARKDDKAFDFGAIAEKVKSELDSFSWPYDMGKE